MGKPKRPLSKGLGLNLARRVPPSLLPTAYLAGRDRGLDQECFDQRRPNK